MQQKQQPTKLKQNKWLCVENKTMLLLEYIIIKETNIINYNTKKNCS